jgi:hypothetical protein
MATYGYRYIKDIWASLRQLANKNVWNVVDTGAPTSGTSGSGAGMCGPGSTYTNLTTGVQYINIGTKASPNWFAPDVNGVNQLRTRLTTAQVNAGGTLVAAVPGFQIQMVDCAMIAVGGAATSSTSINLAGTQASSTVQLIANAVAGLTQSTVLRAGAANSAVLADGASFAPNDVNTAITYAKVGSNLTVATAIDVLFSYRLVAV